jgi:hypothetical protein
MSEARKLAAEDIDEAIKHTLGKIRPAMKHDEALKYSQSVLNLAHAKTLLVNARK